MSLAAAPRANNLSQLNTVTEIKYSSRNSTARDYSMIAVRVKRQYTVLRGVLARFRRFTLEYERESPLLVITLPLGKGG
jgi:hypothetical protein